MAMPRTRRRAVDRPGTGVRDFDYVVQLLAAAHGYRDLAAHSGESGRAEHRVRACFCLRDRGEITVVLLAEPVVHTLSAGPVEALAEDGIPEDLRPVRRPRIVGIRDGGAATLGRE